MDETRWYFKTPGWNHWWMLIALTCDPDFTGSLQQLN